MKVAIEDSWKDRLEGEFAKPYFTALVQKVKQAYQTQEVWPKGSHLFNAFNQCPFDQLKVVILGQDPYPTPGHAHGLCFSVQPTVRPLPKSLVNIFKEVESDIGATAPENGSLERWAAQGVFLLNTVLTVKAHAPNSHKDLGWQTFTDAVIQKIAEEKTGVVFMLWGAQAQKKTDFIDSSRHHILQTVHPSPLSANRGFFGCKHFSKTNALLASQNRSPIHW